MIALYCLTWILVSKVKLLAELLLRIRWGTATFGHFLSRRATEAFASFNGGLEAGLGLLLLIHFILERALMRKSACVQIVLVSSGDTGLH